MATGVQVWSGTAATNATADTNINWAEGMAPSAVNDSARAMMASVAKWRDDNNGTLTTSGTTSALTLVTNQVEGALTNGYEVSFVFGTGVASGATLAVDGLAATPLQLYPGTNLTGTEFSSGANACFTYSTTGTGQWIWKNQCVFPVLSNSLSADVTFTTTGFSDGPSVTQGSSGRWLAIGRITVSAGSASGSNVIAKLWDGTTVIDSAVAAPYATGAGACIPLTGVIALPAGNIKITAACQVAGTGTKMRANMSGIGNTDSTITVIRIG